MATTRDQLLFTETYLALKKAVKRKAYESDSDSSIDQPTNRGNKLKKKARLVREGHLNAPTGASDFKEIVDHSGYQRAILQRNPPLVDDDGYELESGDDEEHIQEAIASAAEFNPYAGIRLENILAPLTSVADLPTHPTLSRVFNSKALDELCIQGRDWMHRENEALWKVRPLLTKLCGDHIWIPCEALESADDILLFEDASPADASAKLVNGADAEHSEAQITAGPTSAPNGTAHEIDGKSKESAEALTSAPTGVEQAESSAEADTSMVDAEGPDGKDKVVNEHGPEKDEHAATEKGRDQSGAEAQKDEPSEKKNGVNGEDHDEAADADITMASLDAPVATSPAKTDNNKNQGDAEPNGVSASTRVISPGLSDAPSIHPLFLVPRSAHPERDAGLPEQEAEDVRRLVQLWIQKQEEVARGVRDLYEGLLKADRLRKTVLKWAKAEAHCGPNGHMSDGEDWYDKEEWGLTEDLKKGHDEEEEDVQLPAKKTRARRQ